ncbi:MAG: hypothetical protein AB9869_18390 [Verrucomicrobiia bacterium]
MTRKTWSTIAVCSAIGLACFGVYLNAEPDLRQVPEVTVAVAPAPEPETPSADAATSSPTISDQQSAPAVAERDPEAPAPKFTPPVAEVVRLTESGVGDDIVKSFIQSCVIPFYLPADHIIALNKRGVPREVIVAMLGRNQELRARRLAHAQSAPGSKPAAPATQAPSIPQAEPGPDSGAQTAYSAATGQAAPYWYNYWYWYANNYPNWFWSPYWAYYPVWHHPVPVRHHRHMAGVPPSNPPHSSQPRWSGAYPNRLITGPNWGADRGPVPSQANWSGAYPNRLIVGPNWGANNGFAQRQSAWSGAYPTRQMAGPAATPNRVPSATAAVSAPSSLSGFQRSGGTAGFRPTR